MATTGLVGTEAQAQTQTDSWSTYQNSKYAFQIQYPSSWTKDESVRLQGAPAGAQAPVVSFTAPQSGYNYINLNIGATVLKPQEQHIPLDAYTAASLYQAKQKFKLNFTALSSNETTLAGVPAEKVVYDILHPAGFTMRLMQLFTINNGTLYVITSGGFPDEFPADLQVFNKMLDSFRFTSTTSATAAKG